MVIFNWTKRGPYKRARVFKQFPSRPQPCSACPAPPSRRGTSPGNRWPSWPSPQTHRPRPRPQSSSVLWLFRLVRFHGINFIFWILHLPRALTEVIYIPWSAEQSVWGCVHSQHQPEGARRSDSRNSLKRNFLYRVCTKSTILKCHITNVNLTKALNGVPARWAGGRIPSPRQPRSSSCWRIRAARWSASPPTAWWTGQQGRSQSWGRREGSFTLCLRVHV